MRSKIFRKNSGQYTKKKRGRNHANKVNFPTTATIVLTLAGTLLTIPQLASAHRSGCHTLHTCPADTDTYVCGDLGYPCDGSTSIKNIDSDTIFVPLTTEKIFLETFKRKPTAEESEYWKKRFRTDKNSIHKLRPAMAWHKNKASSGPERTMSKTVVKKIDKEINTLFASVHEGRMPTPSEYKYWVSRIKDKGTAPAMVGAITFHKEKNIQH
jgi:hypothetical protein